MSRPFSIMPKFTIQTRAAMSDPFAPRLARATVMKASATASTQSTEGKRAVHSLRWPVSLKEAATSQLTNGGLRKYGSLPTWGTSQLPESSIATAGKMRRPSSPLISNEPRPGRKIAAQQSTTIEKVAARDMLTSTFLRKATAGKPSNSESRGIPGRPPRLTRRRLAA